MLKSDLIFQTAYLAVSKLSNELPRTYKLKRQAAELNSRYELKSTPGGKMEYNRVYRIVY